MSENGNKKSNKTKSQNYTSKQRQLQIQHENTVWSIEDVVDGPKIEMVGGKKRKMYKVRWRFVVSISVKGDKLSPFLANFS